MPCEILCRMVWGTSVNSLALILKTINLSLPCKLIFRKSYEVGSPPNFPKLISQLWRIPQAQYFVTLLWARCRLKPLASRLFAQPFVQAQIKDNIKAPPHWSLWGEFIDEFPAQRASKVEIISIWWHHHDALATWVTCLIVQTHRKEIVKHSHH